MNFGDKIQLQRKKKGMTQEELGEELNVSRQTINGNLINLFQR